MKLTREALRRRWKVIKSYIGWEDYIAVGLALLGAVGYFHGFIPFVPHLTDIYMDNRSTLIGVGITVLIIDNINEMYRRRAEKERLILQMGSPDNSFAIEAVRQLRTRGWLQDGSLFRADLHKADLHKADLHEADLSGANLYEADLRGANLFEADLIEADLSFAVLSGADLYKAILVGAYLFDADLYGADFRGANLQWAIVSDEHLAQAESLGGATMPDGEVYDPDTDSEINRLRKESGKDQ